MCRGGGGGFQYSSVKVLLIGCCVWIDVGGGGGVVCVFPCLGAGMLRMFERMWTYASVLPCVFGRASVRL